ncbi:MAG TPA: hypothetical protein VMB52_05025 [Verrucomicrobiae bacterium]|nr:hypothetical protein [Verrucomicrobiae bacterium]
MRRPLRLLPDLYSRRDNPHRDNAGEKRPAFDMGPIDGVAEHASKQRRLRRASAAAGAVVLVGVVWASIHGMQAARDFSKMIHMDQIANGQVSETEAADDGLQSDNAGNQGVNETWEAAGGLIVANAAFGARAILVMSRRRRDEPDYLRWPHEYELAAGGPPESDSLALPDIHVSPAQIDTISPELS